MRVKNEQGGPCERQEKDPVRKTHIWKAGEFLDQSLEVSDQSERGAGKKRKAGTQRQEVDKTSEKREKAGKEEEMIGDDVYENGGVRRLKIV